MPTVVTPLTCAAAAILAALTLTGCQQAAPTTSPSAPASATPTRTPTPTPTKSASRIAAEEVVIASQDALWRTMMGTGNGLDWPKYMRNTRENGTVGYLYQAGKRADSTLNEGIVAKTRAKVSIVGSVDTDPIGGLPTVAVNICEDDSGVVFVDLKGIEMPLTNNVGPQVMTVQEFTDGWRVTEYAPGKSFTC